MSAQRKARAVRAAEFKQEARKRQYGIRTSDELVEDSRYVRNKMIVHESVQPHRVVLAAFVPIPCPCCREFRGIGEFNHYPCACGYTDIHGGRKRFLPQKTPPCVFCGTVRIKNSKFRSCVCIERALTYLKTKETVHRYFFLSTFNFTSI